MADRTGTEKKSRNLFFLFSFIPFLQFIPFFAMNGRLPKRRYVIMGFAYILLIVVGLFLPQFGEAWRNSHLDTPKMEDYLSYADRQKSYNEYKELPGYQEYQAAKEKYWNSDEYRHLEGVRTGTELGGRILTGLTILLAFIMSFFIERYAFIQELEQKEKRGQIYDRLGAVPEAAPVRRPAPAAPVETVQRSVERTPEPVQPSAPAAAELINVNTAGEEELMKLPGMNVIDAKRVLAAREKNGFFATPDDFFASFGARPHVVVNMQNRITLQSAAAAPASGEKAASRFDL